MGPFRIRSWTAHRPDRLSSAVLARYFLVTPMHTRTACLSRRRWPRGSRADGSRAEVSWAVWLRDTYGIVGDYRDGLPSRVRIYTRTRAAARCGSDSVAWLMALFPSFLAYSYPLSRGRASPSFVHEDNLEVSPA